MEDTTGTPDPLVLGSGENGAAGVLAQPGCAANPWHLKIDIQETAPLVLNNNIPLAPADDPVPVPLLYPWGLFTLATLLGAGGAVFLGRKKAGRPAHPATRPLYEDSPR